MTSDSKVSLSDGLGADGGGGPLSLDPDRNWVKVTLLVPLLPQPAPAHSVQRL